MTLPAEGLANPTSSCHGGNRGTCRPEGQDVFDLLRARYDEREAQDDGRPGETGRTWSAEAANILGLAGGVRSVLHLGCGRGELVAALSDHGARASGVDFSEAAIGRGVADGRLFLANVIDMPFEDHGFDLVVALGVLHQVPVDYLDRALREIERVTGRYLLVTLPDGSPRALDSAVIADPYVVQPPWWWTERFAACGWQRVPLPPSMPRVGPPYDNAARVPMLFLRAQAGILPEPGWVLRYPRVLKEAGGEYVLFVAGCLVAGNDLAAARRVLSIGHEAYPDDEGVTVNYASVLIARGETREAETVLETLLGTHEGDREACALLARATLLEGCRRSREALRRIIRSDTDVLDALRGIATTSLALGDTGVAGHYARVGHDLLPGDDLFCDLVRCTDAEGAPVGDLAGTGPEPAAEHAGGAAPSEASAGGRPRAREERRRIGPRLGDYRNVRFFPDHAVLCGEGCHPDEPGGMLLAKDARLRVVATLPGARVSEIALHLAARELEMLPEGQNECTLFVKGQECGRRVFDAEHPSHRVTLGPRELRGADCEVRISSRHACVPCEVDALQTDDRERSLVLGDLRAGTTAGRTPEAALEEPGVCSVCGAEVPSGSGDSGGMGPSCAACGADVPDRARVETLGEILERPGALPDWDPDPTVRILEISGGSTYARGLGERFDCTTARPAGSSNADPSRPEVDLSRLPYPSGTFDAAVLAGTLGPEDATAAAAGELWRVLKPRGALVLDVGVFSREADPVDEDVRGLVARAAVDRLESLGFDVNAVEMCLPDAGIPAASLLVCWKPVVVAFENRAEGTAHVTDRVREGTGLKKGVSLLCATHLVSDFLWQFQRLHVESAFRHTRVPFEYILAVDVDRPGDHQVMCPDFRRWLDEFSEEHANFSWYLDRHWYPQRLHPASRRARHGHSLILDSDCFLIRDRWHDAVADVDAFGFERPNIPPEWRFWLTGRQPLDSAFFGYRTADYPEYVNHAGGGHNRRDRALEYQGHFFPRFTPARGRVFLPMAGQARDRLGSGEDLAVEMYHPAMSALARDGRRIQFLDPWLGLLVGYAQILDEERTYSEDLASREPLLLSWHWQGLDRLESPAARTRAVEEALALHVTYFSVTSTAWQKMEPRPRSATRKLEKILELVEALAGRTRALPADR